MEKQEILKSSCSNVKISPAYRIHLDLVPITIGGNKIKSLYMRFIKIKKYKFTFDFFETGLLYPFYGKILNKTNNQYLINTNNISENGFKDFIHVVNYINPFFTLFLNEKVLGLNNLKIYHSQGFMADLRGYSNVDEYMKDKMSSRSRRKIRGNLKKLETCFNIDYKMYFGNISEKEYNFIIHKLHSFIVKRFSQRGERHEAMAKWEYIEKNTYEMILNKQASFFVIYNGDRPIDICLNYHHGNIVNNSIGSYDIDYSKFRLGYIDILKQIEWCFKNKINIFDLSIGDFEYKRLWCNVEYIFENQILYNKKDIPQTCLAYGLTIFYGIKEFLKKKNVHLLYKKIKNHLQKKPKEQEKLIETECEIIEIKSRPKKEEMTNVDFHLHQFYFLPKIIYDFQYLHSESSTDIKVYKINDEKDLYFISGKIKSQQFKISHPILSEKSSLKTPQGSAN